MNQNVDFLMKGSSPLDEIHTWVEVATGTYFIINQNHPSMQELLGVREKYFGETISECERLLGRSLDCWRQ